MNLLRGEARWAAFGLACCLGVAIVIASRAELFFLNALYYLVTQGFVLAFAFMRRARPAAIGGVAVATSLYLAAFSAWVQAMRDPEGLIWLGYLFSLPGAAVATGAIVLWLEKRPQWAPFIAFGIAATAVILGVSLNQVIVCKTMMYCALPHR